MKNARIQIVEDAQIGQMARKRVFVVSLGFASTHATISILAIQLSFLLDCNLEEALIKKVIFLLLALIFNKEKRHSVISLFGV
jgi:hypothetical protein